MNGYNGTFDEWLATQPHWIPEEEQVAYAADHIDEHGKCPLCWRPVVVYDDAIKRTHSCPNCGYHDVSFKGVYP